jgi:hypothetical protein
MVLDWRAPISRKFYQASVKDPQGVANRRRFGFVKGELTSFEDEHLRAWEELGTSRAEHAEEPFAAETPDAVSRSGHCGIRVIGQEPCGLVLVHEFLVNEPLDRTARGACGAKGVPRR